MTPAVPVQELAAVFSAGDIVVIPGGTSLSALEAAGCGRPVVMNDQPASRWRAKAGVGLTFPEGDVSSLRQLLLHLARDPGERLRLGEVARAAVLDGFSYDYIAEQLETDMRQAIALHRERRSPGRSLRIVR